MKRLLSGAFWSVLGNLSVRLLGFLSLAALVRIMGQADFGRYALVFGWLQNAQSMTGLGIDTAMQRELSRKQASNDAMGSEQVYAALLWPALLALIASIFIFIYAGWVAIHWLGNAELVEVVRISCVGLAIWPFSVILTGLQASRREFRGLAKNNTITAGGLAIASVAGAILAGLEGAAWAFAAAGLTQLFLLLRHPMMKRRRAGMKRWDVIPNSLRLLKLGFPYYLGNTLAGALVGACLTIIVAKWVQVEQVGVLRVGQALISLLLLAPSALTGVILPTASGLYLQDATRYEFFRALHFKLMWIVGCSATIFTLQFIPEWLRVFDLDSTVARHILGLLLLNLPLLVVNPVITTYLVAEGATLLIAVGSSLGSAMVLILGYMLIPLIGLTGYCLASIAGYILGALLLLGCNRGKISGGRQAMRIALALIPTVTLLVASYFAPGISDSIWWRGLCAIVLTFLCTWAGWRLLLGPAERAAIMDSGKALSQNIRGRFHVGRSARLLKST